MKNVINLRSLRPSQAMALAATARRVPATAERAAGRRSARRPAAASQREAGDSCLVHNGDPQLMVHVDNSSDSVTKVRNDGAWGRGG